MVYLLHHLGMGDHIICNGLARSIQAKYNSSITVFSQACNIKNVSRMFEGQKKIETRIIPTPTNGFDGFDYYGYINSFVKRDDDIAIVSGFNDMFKYQQLNFDEVFYKSCGVPFSSRWDNFHYERDSEKETEALKKLNPSEEPFAFVHDDESRGYRLNIENANKLKIVKNDPSVGLFDLGKVFEQAAEIHCMESSIKCLVDSIPNLTAKLYFYPNVRGFGAISKHTKDWTLV